MTEQERRNKIVELALEFRRAHLLKCKDDVTRARVLLFMAIDEMEAERESRRSAQEGVGACPGGNGVPSEPVAGGCGPDR